MSKTFQNIASVIVFLYLLLPLPAESYANDAAAGYAAGGIVLLEQKDISIEREHLYIYFSDVEVEYVFKNNSDKDIKTLVAFPLPPYDPREELGDQGPPDFSKFSVKENNIEVPYQTEVKAYAGDRDVTALLKQAGLDITNLWSNRWGLIDAYRSLNKDQMKFLVDNDLEYANQPEEGSPSKWIVYVKYYWEQVFPANSTINVKHTYMANTGTRVAGDSWGAYILTTAKTWKMPIKEFHARVEGWSKVSGVPLKQTGPARFEAIIENFVPEHELMLGTGQFGSSYGGKTQMIR